MLARSLTSFMPAYLTIQYILQIAFMAEVAFPLTPGSRLSPSWGLGGDLLLAGLTLQHGDGQNSSGTLHKLPA